MRSRAVAILKRLIRGRQIPIALAAPTRSPARFSSLGGFRTPAAPARGNVRQRPASENLHKGGNGAFTDAGSAGNRSRGSAQQTGTESQFSRSLRAAWAAGLLML